MPPTNCFTFEKLEEDEEDKEEEEESPKSLPRLLVSQSRLEGWPKCPPSYVPTLKIKLLIHCPAAR